MDCPKCKSFMEEKTLSTLQGGVTVDRCTGCQGLWFDIGEAETLKDK
ncbi:MAG: zf-TFIIB domain-containing protein, partial [Gammaproteobacteria bacterium]|nr:zf-TFIIB domain-containing protein [Gammaproteobacteria bacterium]